MASSSPGPLLSRRAALAGAAGVLGAAAVGAGAAHAAALAPFPHGVASGDPLADRVILWTRVEPPVGHDGTPIPLEWAVATTPDLTDPAGRVASGSAAAVAERGWCVHVDPTGLAPATSYYYGFVAPTLGGRSSLTGRTRTAPASGSAVDRLRFALVSCSNYRTGFFNPYARLAERDDLDLVVHVGDYIYETGGGMAVRRHVPDREIVSLDDYRTRYAQYRSDPDLQAAHQQHPWALVWDDHEFTNNAWLDGAGNHQPATEGDWISRRGRAVQAYCEWMPLRVPDAADPLRIWRHLPYGDVADLFLIDTRIYGRNAPETPTDITGTGSDDPTRRMLGDVQRGWLLDGMEASSRRGVAWRVVGNQTMISPHNNLPPGAIPDLPPEVGETTGTRQGGANEGGDNWGAYRVERDLVIGGLRDRGVRDNVVLTGDIHTSWGCDIVENPFPPAYVPRTGLGSVGVELVCMSVTSNNLQETAPEAAPALNAAIVAGNQNVAYADQAAHGYVLLDLDADRAQGEWWKTGDARVRSTTETLGGAFQSLAGTDHLIPALGASTPPTGRAAAAPTDPPAATEPPPAVPDVPFPALVPLGAALVGALVAVRRRGERPEPEPT